MDFLLQVLTNGPFCQSFVHLLPVASSLCWILGILLSQLKLYHNWGPESYSRNRQHNRLKTVPLVLKVHLDQWVYGLNSSSSHCTLKSGVLEVTQVSGKARNKWMPCWGAQTLSSEPLNSVNCWGRCQVTSPSCQLSLGIAFGWRAPNTRQCLRALSVWGHPVEWLRPCCDCIADLPLSNPASFTSFTVADPRALPNQLPAC